MAAVAAAGFAVAFGTAPGAALRAQDKGPAPAPAVVFNREILPILAANCFACHGPDEKQRETKFHFDTKEGAFAEEGIIVPGNAAKSVLVKMITEPDPAKRMPPADSGHALTEKQIALLRRWIDEGATWDTHWAYTPPSRPEPPLPKQYDWVRNPVDQFILARLERDGLKPSEEADKVTLLRRVTYDLTGLPPTPAEIDAFLADRSPEAYESRVDALLTSERYGERMAMPWLDAARYADTHGYHIDSHRVAWPWRDWVIGAFNRNMPFDRFVLELRRASSGAELAFCSGHRKAGGCDNGMSRDGLPPRSADVARGGGPGPGQRPSTTCAPAHGIPADMPCTPIAGKATSRRTVPSAVRWCAACGGLRCRTSPARPTP
jgi:mono/diheme cytochrome c family protein